MGSVAFFQPEFRIKRQGLPDLLRYDSCIAPGVILGKGGELITTFKYRGPDMQCSDDGEIEYLRGRVNDMIKRLRAGWMIHSTTLRIESIEYSDEGDFPDPVTAMIEQERVRQYRTEGDHFENDYYLTFTYIPDSIVVGKIKEFAYETNGVKASPEANLIKTLDYFERQVKEYVGILETGMQGTRMVRLMPHQELDPVTRRVVWHEDQLAFISECLIGSNSPRRLPEACPPMGVDYILGSYQFLTGLKPEINGTKIRVIAVEGLPDAGTHFGILEVLNKLGVKFRWTTRWIARDPERAKASTRKVMTKWRQKIHGFIADATGRKSGNVNKDAAEMAADAAAVLNDLESGAVSYGFWTSTVVLMGRDVEYLSAAAEYVYKNIDGLGFPCRIEDVNCVEAFLGSLPGHGYENVRRPEIHSMNLADCLPLTSTWQGPASNPCSFYKRLYKSGVVPPIFQGSSSGGTPFRVVLHNGDVGHTMVLGPTGAGKSTILGLLAQSHFRYPGARLWAFEKGESLLALCRGAQGQHFSFMDDDSPGSNEVAFAPFVHIDRVGDTTWAIGYVEAILEINGLKATTDISNEIERAMKLLATRPSDMRSLTDLNGLIQLRQVKKILEQYERSFSGGMLNGRRDSINAQRFTVFEMEKLMELKEKHVAPVLLYLFRMIERSLDGSPVMIILDEAWLFLAYELFQDKLREWLKVLRKANAIVIFATQELQDISGSAIASTIFSACKTMILLPNASAASESESKLYKSVGLTDREIDLLVTATPKRHYFFKSPAGRRLFELELGPVALAFFGASGVDDRKLVKQLYAEHGDDWVKPWMVRQNIPADLLRRAADR